MSLIAACIAIGGTALFMPVAVFACSSLRETGAPLLAQARLDAAGELDKGWLAEASAIEIRARQIRPAIAIVDSFITVGWLGEGRETWAAHFSQVGNLGLPGTPRRTRCGASNGIACSMSSAPDS